MSETTRRVLVVGTGSIGERHLRCFAKTGRAEVSLVEPDPARRDAVAGRNAVERAWASLDEALAAPPEAAVIATPAPHHVAIARRLAAVGVHLLIEKPLATDLRGVDALEREAEAGSLVVAVGYVWRAHPVIAALRDAVVSERFGRPLEITVVSGQHFPHYRPAYREIYYRDRALGGGAVQDAITHVLNAGEWIVGPIDRLVADGAHLALPGVDVEDTVHVLTRQGAVMGSYCLNQHQAPDETTLKVVCERGTVCAETHRHRLRWMVEASGEWETVEPAAVDRDGPFVRQAEAFLDAIEGRAPPLCTLQEGVQTLKVNLAVLASCDRLEGWQSVGEARCGTS